MEQTDNLHQDVPEMVQKLVFLLADRDRFGVAATQRKLILGYNEACRLLGQAEQLGIISRDPAVTHQYRLTEKGKELRFALMTADGGISLDEFISMANPMSPEVGNNAAPRRNMISILRERVQQFGEAKITLDEFNQLQAEWIKRVKPD